MTAVRFVIDESSWCVPGIAPTDYRHSLELLSDRLEVARGREERVAFIDDFYQWPSISGSVTELLFEENDILERDQRYRLFQLLDSCEPTRFPEDSLDDIICDGAKLVAPGIWWAHDQVSQRQSIGVLPLSCGRQSGKLEIQVGEKSLPIHFVCLENEHLAFFRDAFEWERCDQARYQTLIPSAFPLLLWVDDIWREARRFASPFEEIRSLLTKHFSVLNDDGPEIFRTTNQPHEIISRFAAAGIDATGESGKTKDDNQARRERTRIFQGKERIFWWHTKLFWNTGRIHFLYDEDLSRIVVGVFADHLKT